MRRNARDAVCALRSALTLSLPEKMGTFASNPVTHAWSAAPVPRIVPWKPSPCKPAWDALWRLSTQLWGGMRHRVVASSRRRIKRSAKHPKHLVAVRRAAVDGENLTRGSHCGPAGGPLKTEKPENESSPSILVEPRGSLYMLIVRMLLEAAKHRLATHLI
jgi:hypothetical protein